PSSVARRARPAAVVRGPCSPSRVCWSRSAPSSTRNQIDMSSKRKFSAREPVRQDDAAINAEFAGTNTLIVLVEGNAEGALEEPAVMRAIYRLERNLEAEPGVGKALSYVDFVRKMHLAMNADRPDLGELPATRALTAQYLFLYTLAGGAD